MNKLYKNWSYLLVSDITQQLVGFVVVIFLARKLSPEGYGQYNVIISIATIFSVVANFGMNSVVIREVSVRPQETAHLIRNIIVPIKSITLILAIALFYGYTNFITLAKYDWPGFIIIIILNLTLWDFSESVAFGHQVTKFSSILNILFSVTWLCIIIFAPSELFNVRSILFIYCILHLIKAVVYLIVVYRQFYIPSLKELVQYGISRIGFLKMTSVYFWLLGISTLAQQLPVQFLNSNSSLREVGFYSVGNKLMIPIGIAVGTAFKTLFPFMIKLYSENRESFLEKMKLGFGLIITIGTVLAVVLSLTSKFWLVLLFGEEYRESIIVFNFLVWYSIISILDTLLSNGLSSSYKEKVLAILATIDIIIVIPLVYFGSFHGAYGLALWKLISGLVLLSFHWIVFVKVLKVKMRNGDVLILFAFFVLSMVACNLPVHILLRVGIILLVGIIAVSIKDSPVASSMSYLRSFHPIIWIKCRK